MAGFTALPTTWPRNFRPLPNTFGALFNTLARAIGDAGGAALTGTATTTLWLPIPAARVFSVESAGMIGNVPAAGGSTVTAQLIKQSGATATTLTAATSIKSDVITGTNVNAFDWPITGSDSQRTLNGPNGDTLRWEVVAATTVTTQPQLVAVAEIAIQR
jgi:hypothetical protein